MEILSAQYQLISELSKLKIVLRNTQTMSKRQESTAEHSWSASMITLIVMQELKQEFPTLDELKILKLTLIHDIVEIYAGDVIVFDAIARKDKLALEQQALATLVSLCPSFGTELEALWNEFEAHTTLEAKVAKAADSICPIFQRLAVKQSYIPYHVDLIKLEKTKQPYFEFSQTFSTLFKQLKEDLIEAKLIKTELTKNTLETCLT